MLRLLLTVAVLSFTAHAIADAPPEPSGMQVIFNGKDLTGWDGDPRLWSVKEGVIHGETTAENPAKGNTFIIWTGAKPATSTCGCRSAAIPPTIRAFSTAQSTSPKAR